ncbi:hypothetical protein PI125_g10999 [Phytophthora idaei]|nr:hypothetical protein PI125_g10999 [Phytophthora idaei]
MPRRQYATVDDVDVEDMFENDKEEEKLSGTPRYEAFCPTSCTRDGILPTCPYACRRLCRRRAHTSYVMFEDLQASAEADRIDCFKEGRITGELDFENVKSIMSSRLRMDIVLAAANSRVSNLSHEMYQILEMENMEWMVKREPKKIANYLIDALTLGQLQRTVRGEKVCESNKSLLKNVVAFINWLRTSSNACLRWEPSASRRSQPGARQNHGGRKAVTLHQPILRRRELKFQQQLNRN